MRILQRSVKNVKLESENWKKDHGFSAVMANAILENVESRLYRNKRRGRGKGKRIKDRVDSESLEVLNQVA